MATLEIHIGENALSEGWAAFVFYILLVGGKELRELP